MNLWRETEKWRKEYHVTKETASYLNFLHVFSLLLSAVICGAVFMCVMALDERILKLNLIASLPGESEYWVLFILFALVTGHVSGRLSSRWIIPILRKESGLGEVNAFLREIGDEIAPEILQTYMDNTKDNRALDRLLKKHLKKGQISASQAIRLLQVFGARNEAGFEEMLGRYQLKREVKKTPDGIRRADKRENASQQFQTEESARNEKGIVASGGEFTRSGMDKAAECDAQWINMLNALIAKLPKKQSDWVRDRIMQAAVRHEEKKRAYEERIDAIWNGVPKRIIAACEEERGNGFVVERILIGQMEAGKIEERYAKELITLYHRLEMPEKKTTLEAMRRVICAEESGAEAGSRRRIICGFDKEKLNEFKRMLLFMPQEAVDRIWDEYMLRAAKAAEKKYAESGETAK